MNQLRVYVNFRNAMKRLSYEEKGMLFDAMLAYADDQTLLPLKGKADALWDWVQDTLDAQIDSYKQRCETNRQNRTGGKRTVTNHHDSSQDILSYDKDKDKKQEQEKDKITKYKDRPQRAKVDYPQHSGPSEDDLKQLFVNLDSWAEEHKI